MDSTNFTKNIVKALENLGGEALLHEIYDEFKRICDEQGENLSEFNKYNGIDNWKSSIRRRLQQHSSTSSQYIKNKPDLFVGPSKIKKGLWALKDNKNSVYVIAYYLSKFLDYNGEKNHSYKSLGFTSRKEASQIIAKKFNEKESNVKNFEDVFDPIHDNHRKGWHQKPLPKKSKRIVELFGNFSKDQLQEYVSALLNNEKQMIKKIENKPKGNPDKVRSNKQEDELYNFFEKLGFDKNLLGKRVHFQSVGGKGEIDVIAKNGNTIFICHCSQNKIMKNLEERMEKLPFIHGKIVSYLKKPNMQAHEKWKIDDKTNVIMIFDVKGNEVGTGEKIRSRMASDPNTFKNAHLWDTEFRNYYLKELKLDKEIARNWLMYVSGVKETNEQAEFEAIKVNYGLGDSVPDSYLFTADVESFYRHAYVQQRRPYHQSADYYQRLLKPKRMKDIGEYIDGGSAYFPNNIIVNIEHPENAIEFIPSKDNPNFGVIKFKRRCCAHVIDGQHRLFSYLKSKKFKDSAKVVINALTVEPSQEHEFFVKINDEQQGVDQELIWDLKGEMYKNAADGKISNTWKKINQSYEDGYFHQMIKMPSFRAMTKRGQTRRKQYLSLGGLCRVTQDKFVGIYGNKTRYNKNNYFYFDPTDKKDIDKGPEKLASIITDFFNRLYKVLPENYQKKFLHDGGKQKIKAGIHYVMLDICRFAIEEFKVNTNKFPSSFKVEGFFKELKDSIVFLGEKDLQGQGQYQDYLKDLVHQIRLNFKYKDFAKPDIVLDVDDTFREEYIESKFEGRLNTILLNLFSQRYGDDYIEKELSREFYSNAKQIRNANAGKPSSDDTWEIAKTRNGGNLNIDMQFHFHFGASFPAFFDKSKLVDEFEDIILKIHGGPFVSMKEFKQSIQKLWDYNKDVKHKESRLLGELNKLKAKDPKITIDKVLLKKYDNKTLLEYKRLAEKVLSVFDGIAEKEGFLWD